MKIHNPNDPVVTSDEYTVHARAHRLGHVVAKYRERGHRHLLNPFKPGTVLWLSFNLGAREYLEALPQGIVRPAGGFKSGGFTAEDMRTRATFNFKAGHDAAKSMRDLADILAKINRRK